jgi:hypothetical protein
VHIDVTSKAHISITMALLLMPACFRPVSTTVFFHHLSLFFIHHLVYLLRNHQFTTAICTVSLQKEGAARTLVLTLYASKVSSYQFGTGFLLNIERGV